MRIVLIFLFMLSVLTVAGCGGSGSLLSGSKNVSGRVMYRDTGDDAESGTVIFDSGTDSYRVEISGDGSYQAQLPAGTYKVWFENVGKLPVRKEYLSPEKTPVQVNVSGEKQTISLDVTSDSRAKKR